MKIKYLFYIGVATLALSGCNDGFLERAPEAINDKTFWNNVQETKRMPINSTVICPEV